MSRRSDILRPLTALVLGVLVFVAGLEAARRWLPEWRAEVPEEAFFLQRSREVAGRLGFRPAPGGPRVELVTNDNSPADRLREMDGSPPDVATAAGVSLRVRVFRKGMLPWNDRRQELVIGFSPLGAVQFVMTDPEGTPRSGRPGRFPPEREGELARLLVAPGESLGERRDKDLPGDSTAAYALVGSDPPRHVTLEIDADGSVSAVRQPGTLDRSPGGAGDSIDDWGELFVLIVAALGFLGAIILFLLLLGRRRIDLFNGALLGVFTILGALPPILSDPTLENLAENLLPAFFLGVWVLMLWSAGESFLRTVQPGLTVHLDSLRAGRLGPGSGRAILTGLSVGAALAGLRLGIYSLAWALPGWWLEEHSLEIPVFQEVSPYLVIVQFGATVALALALGLRFLPSRWATWGACLVAGTTILAVSLRPFPAQIAANLAIAGALVLLGRRQGLAAVLAALFALLLLPAAVFSGLHLQWLPLTFALSVLPLGLLLVIGLVGIARPAEGETARLKQPAFMRRMEDERRLKYEMDLLARMQLGLLPDNLPEIPGWEIAARSLIANEAGGDLYDFIEDEDGQLWIAAGDVAGHGYSCAIVQAMTTAALSSLVTAGKTPSEVLRGVDRVIRRGSSRRNFTSLALLRLDPRTGAILFANAGHPYPFLCVDGDASEIPMSGLPLGQGPERTYRDHRFEIPPGGTLVFCSDGLFEAIDDRQAPYGFDRPRDLLRSLGDRSASGLLEALLADWRRHLKTEEPPDDTTVVVVRRLGQEIETSR
ncbi:MAG TPA: PP2C family protein-serine/threonine phosphatase [Thermoanaerobaculia bacterium]|nr:PP2C family protein-serine/threonine phosphatase [Thermoanaerobaculia bacterium]